MHRRFFVVDVIVLTLYAASSLPGITSVAVHEWLGLVTFVALAVHLGMHMDWAFHALKPSERRSAAQAGRLVLDALLLIALVVCVVSGVFVSGAVLPSLGLYAEGYYFWDPLHAASAKVLLALLVVHLVANVRMIAGLMGKGEGHDA